MSNLLYAWLWNKTVSASKLRSLVLESWGGVGSFSLLQPAPQAQNLLSEYQSWAFLGETTMNNQESEDRSFAPATSFPGFAPTRAPELEPGNEVGAPKLNHYC